MATGYLVLCNAHGFRNNGGSLCVPIELSLLFLHGQHLFEWCTLLNCARAASRAILN